MKIKHLSYLGIFCLSSFAGGALAQVPPSMLEYKEEHPDLAPLWISAEKASDEEKIIDLDLFGTKVLLPGYVEAQRQSLNDGAAKAPGGNGKPPIVGIPLSECVTTIMPSTHRGGQDPKENLTDLSNYSRLIVRGAIRTVQMGFTAGTPSSLLGVEVLEVIKGDPPPNPLYIDYSVASFKIGPYRFCNGNKGFEPRPGDEVLLFDYIGPTDRDRVLYVPNFEQLFFQRPQGILIVPPSLKNTPELEAARSLDEIIGRLRSGKVLDAPGVDR